jgi:hypothetical protein
LPAIGAQAKAFASNCHDAGVRFSIGYELKARAREAIVALSEAAWQAAIDAEGKAREGAQVAELTEEIDLSTWPEGTRLIVRRERPHPGAQFQVFDADGYRHTAFITDQDDERHSQSGSASVCCTSPGASRAPPGARRFACRATGPGQRLSQLPSRGCGHCPPELGHRHLGSRRPPSTHSRRMAASACAECFALAKQKADQPRVCVTCLTLANYTRGGENGESGVRNSHRIGPGPAHTAAPDPCVAAKI